MNTVNNIHITSQYNINSKGFRKILKQKLIIKLILLQVYKT